MQNATLIAQETQPFVPAEPIFKDDNGNIDLASIWCDLGGSD